MKVLIASSDATLRRRFANWLLGGRHEALEAENTKTACTALHSKPDVIVLDWALGGGGGAVFVKCARDLDKQHHHYIIAVCARPQPSDIPAFISAGADDFMSTNAPREEVLARVDALTRFRGWATKLTHARAIDFGDGFDLETLRVWRDVESTVTAEISEMLATALTVEQRSDAAMRWRGAVPLTLSAEQVELHFGVGLAAESGEQFAQDVLGIAVNDASILDALREIANVAAGAVKRAAFADGVAMTIGVPTGDDVFAMAGARRWSTSTASGLRLTFAIAAASSQVMSVRRCELREGMVLASDIRTSGGVLLVTAGTYLTTTTVQRLERFLDANERIAVSSRPTVAKAS